MSKNPDSVRRCFCKFRSVQPLRVHKAFRLCKRQRTWKYRYNAVDLAQFIYSLYAHALHRHPAQKVARSQENHDAGSKKLSTVVQ
eukprot:3960168-Karenia_brevis.AAC.1